MRGRNRRWEVSESFESILKREYDCGYMVSTKKSSKNDFYRGLRIWAPPTHFQKFVANFKTEFLGNRTKSLISPESARFTVSYRIFWRKKIASTKKLHRFLFPEFNLIIIFTVLIFYLCVNKDLFCKQY